MSKIKFCISFFALFIGISFLQTMPVFATNNNDMGINYEDDCKGELPPTQEELQWMEENMVHTVGANLNLLGIKRVNEELEKRGIEKLDESRAVEFGEEAISENETKELKRARKQLQKIIFKSSVDNMSAEDTKNYFPPIVDQIGDSCAAYSTTYYIMTYMNAMANGYNVKTDPSKILSPRFTYNLGNNGKDEGTGGTTCFQIALDHGCPFIVDFPLSGNYQHTAWPTTGEIWRKALNNKMKETGDAYFGSKEEQTPIKSNQDENLNVIKEYLTNGYILKMSTYFEGWKWKKCYGTNENVCIAVDGTKGSHGMTVVGYDDNIWVDINGNGTKEDGEMGAFKIVNSHGSNWNGNGWAWFAYDAINEISSVPGAPVYNQRQKGWFDNAFYWITANKSYSPILTVEFTVNTNRRDQISIMLGQSVSTASGPTSFWIPFGFYKNGGAFSVEGTTSISSATIVLDYSEIIKKTDLSKGGKRKWYFMYEDMNVAISNIRIKDETRNTFYNLEDRNKFLEYICKQKELSMPGIVETDKQWNLNFNWPLNPATITKKNIYVRDTKNNDEKINLKWSSDGRTVTVEAPDGGYASGKRYMMNITRNVKTKGDNSLSEPAVFEFIVK